jgi:hypothetical protein
VCGRDADPSAEVIVVMLIIDKHIVLLTQRGKPRSKYHDLWCSCRRRRKRDGGCKHLDAVLAEIKPERRKLVRILPPRSS